MVTGNLFQRMQYAILKHSWEKMQHFWLTEDSWGQIN